MQTVIVGAGDYGKEIKKRFFKGRDVVFYDNDRRKWNTECDGAKVISLSMLLELIEQKCPIVVGGHSPSLLHFIKDATPPHLIIRFFKKSMVI